MTDLIEQLRKLAGQTTEGPWVSDFEEQVDLPCLQVCEIEGRHHSVCVFAPNASDEQSDRAWESPEQDATLISLAPAMAKKLLTAEAVVRAMHDLSEWQSYDSARAVFDPPMPEKYECTDDAKEALVSALDAYEAL